MYIEWKVGKYESTEGENWVGMTLVQCSNHYALYNFIVLFVYESRQQQ